MHDFLRAVGFSHIHHKRDLQRILDMVMGGSEESFAWTQGMSYAEKIRNFAGNAGVTVRGDLDEHGLFSYDYYFPHYSGRHSSVTEDVTLEKTSDREAYDGICDLDTLGVSLIFHMNRLGDYAHRLSSDKKVKHADVMLSALSISGKVILPLARNEAQQIKCCKENEARRNLIAAARQGDQSAIESLTFDDIDLYTTVIRRLRNEDVLSIVESSFMPYGIYCDQYSVVAEILEVKEAYNQLTGEKLWQMVITCNDLTIDLCMNAEDLLGEPLPGRRFRGNIWLQGQLA